MDQERDVQVLVDGSMQVWRQCVAAVKEVSSSSNKKGIGIIMPLYN